jgi:microcin C transport system permease protein
MTSYIIRRLLLMLPTLIGIMTLCFIISEFVPGGPIDQVRARLEGKGPGSGGSEAGGGSGGGGRGGGDAKVKKVNPKDEMRMLRQYGYHTTRFERYLRTILWFNPDSAITSKEIDLGEGVYFQSHRRKHIVIRIKDAQGQETYRAFAAAPFLGMKTVPRQGFLSLFSSTREIPDYGNEASYDKTAGVLRDTLDEAICYDAVTGARQLAGSGPGLTRIELSSRPASRRTTYRLAYDEKDKKISNLLADSLLQEARQKATPAEPVRKEADGTETIVTRLPNQMLTTRWAPADKKLTVVDDYTEVHVKESLLSSIANWENWHGYFLLKFGYSINYPNQSTYDLIVERLPISMRLGILSFFITYIGCITLGISKAVRHNTAFDSWSSAVVLIGYSIPGFVLAVVLLATFGEAESAWVHWFPSGRIHSPDAVYQTLAFWPRLWDNLQHMLAPAICLTIGSFATLTMFTKNNILNETHQLYAVAARARGLSERKVLFKHILRNAFVPLVTGFPGSFLFMFFSGSLLIEKIFNLQGIGLLGYTAIMSRDYPVVMGDLFMFGALGLFARLLTDICYVIADPRISFEGNKS